MLLLLPYITFFECFEFFESEAIRYCYMDIVRKCLEDFMEHWNHHYIRKSKDHSVHGKPELLYYLGTLILCW